MKKIIAPLILGCALLASAAPAYADPAEAATGGDALLNHPAFNAIDELSRASDPSLAYPELISSLEIRCTGC
jgi:hypothetical protein